MFLVIQKMKMKSKVQAIKPTLCFIVYLTYKLKNNINMKENELIESLILNNIDEVKQRKLIEFIKLNESQGHEFISYDELGSELVVTFSIK